ncbi:MAG: hypothetical protein OEZ02_10815, partial [Anaerolineae bacterium]|nr:hypothetical protein [Anaerolineae bacterium]
QWNAAAGYLPPRPSSLALWPANPLQALASQIVPNAQLVPSQPVIETLAAALSNAVIKVLKQELSAADAAQFAIQELEQK